MPSSTRRRMSQPSSNRRISRRTWAPSRNLFGPRKVRRTLPRAPPTDPFSPSSLSTGPQVQTWPRRSRPAPSSPKTSALKSRPGRMRQKLKGPSALDKASRPGTSFLLLSYRKSSATSTPKTRKGPSAGRRRFCSHALQPVPLSRRTELPAAAAVVPRRRLRRGTVLPPRGIIKTLSVGKRP